MKINSSQLDRFIASRRSWFESTLASLIACRSVSKDPQYSSEIHRVAETAAKTIREVGGDAEVVATKGHPAVIGAFRVSRPAATVTIYNHLDVQPAEIDDGWTREPFQMVIEGDRYFGRGTTDDKGPALMALLAALTAREFDLPVDVNFLWDGEEEIGSPNLKAVLGEAGRKLSADRFIISDTEWISPSRPSIVVGLKGYIGFELSLQTATKEAHSGSAGGAARNPVAEIAQILSEMHDGRTGRVRVPGFYDGVKPLSNSELRQFLRSGFDVAYMKRALGLRSLRVSDRAQVLRRIWAEPTFEVHGIVGGYSGPGIKSIVPPSAVAKVSCRLVPHQQPARVFAAIRRFVRKRNPDVRIRLVDATALPFLAPDSVRSELIEAYRAGLGKTPSFVRDGGTVPVATMFEQRFHRPVLLLGFSLPEHNYHAANENFDWPQASAGARTLVRYLEHLGTTTAA